MSCNRTSGTSWQSSSLLTDRVPRRDHSYYDNQQNGVLSIKAFNADLDAIALKNPQHAQEVLQRMEELYEQDPTNSSLVQPDSASYTIVIEGWCQRRSAADLSGGDSLASPNFRDGNNTRSNLQLETQVTAATAAQALLDIMEQSDRLTPSSLPYLVVCQKWAESPFPDDTTGRNAVMAQQVLNRYRLQMLEELKDSSSNSNSSATTATSSPVSSMRYPPSNLGKLYATVLDGWCRLTGIVPNAMDQAEALLQEMENSQTQQISSTPPTKSATTGLRKNRRRQNRTVEDTCNQNNNSGIINLSTVLRPNTMVYTSLIGGISRSKQPDMGRKADAVLERMKRFGVELDIVVYTSILNCWAKVTSLVERHEASKRVLELLEEVEDSYIRTENNNYLLKPSPITYATAIKAIGYSLDPDAPTAAERILRRMYTLTESGTIHVPPTVGNYNAVITALSTSGSKQQKAANARKAEALLVEMIQRSRLEGEFMVEPTVITWGSVLRAWADSGEPDSGEQAQRVLEQFEEWFSGGNCQARPNVVCYTTVISAWAKGRATPELALEKVNGILRKMERVYEETLDVAVRPNKITYITAIGVFCRKSPKTAGSMAQELVSRMVTLYSKNIGYERPTRLVFNTLINAWSKSEEHNSAENAETIFQWMESQYSAGDESVKPDAVTLCAVLNAWANNAKEGGALRAQQIMDYTEGLTLEERGFDHSIVCYNVLIKAWGRSGAADSVHRAEAVLVHLEKRYRSGKSTIKPDITTYCSVINCCAYSIGSKYDKAKAFEVALRTFRKIKGSDDLEVNNIVYGTLFKAIGKLNLLGYKREQMVKELFLECREAGRVCSFVLSQVRASIPLRLYRELVLKPSSLEDRYAGNFELIVRKMPLDWSRNVLN